MRLGGGQEISLTLPRWFHTAFKTLRDAPAKSRKTSCKNLDFAERIGSVLDRLGSVFEGMGRVLYQLGRVLEAPRKSSQRLQDSSTTPSTRLETRHRSPEKQPAKNLDFAERIGEVVGRLGSVLGRIGSVMYQLALRRSSSRCVFNDRQAHNFYSLR